MQVKIITCVVSKLASVSVCLYSHNVLRCSLAKEKCFQLAFEVVVANVRMSQAEPTISFDFATF